jgi:hypothetical protein
MGSTILNLPWIGKALRAPNLAELENISNPITPYDKVLTFLHSRFLNGLV